MQTVGLVTVRSFVGRYTEDGDGVFVRNHLQDYSVVSQNLRFLFGLQRIQINPSDPQIPPASHSVPFRRPFAPDASVRLASVQANPGILRLSLCPVPALHSHFCVFLFLKSATGRYVVEVSYSGGRPLCWGFRCIPQSLQTTYN